MIPEYLPDSLHGFLWLIEPTITLLQLIAYGVLTLASPVAILASHLEDRERNT